VGAKYTKRYNPKLVLLVGFILVYSGILLASISPNFIVFEIFYALVFPCGCGIITYVHVVSAWEWFPKRRALVTGLVTSAYGLSPLIFESVV
jgi:MFS family permease